MTSETKQYVSGFWQGECSSFGPDKDRIHLWPGEIQMDLTQKKAPLKGIYLLGAGNAVPLTVGLYDKEGKELYKQNFEKMDFKNWDNPIEVQVVYSHMEKVKYISLFSYEGYYKYVHFVF